MDAYLVKGYRASYTFFVLGKREKMQVKQTLHGNYNEKRKILWDFQAFILSCLITLFLLLTTNALYIGWRNQYIEKEKGVAQLELLNLRKNLFLLFGNQEMFTSLIGQWIEEFLETEENPTLEQLSSSFSFLKKHQPSFLFATLVRNAVVVDQYPVSSDHSLGFNLSRMPLYEEHVIKRLQPGLVSVDGPIQGGTVTYLVNRIAIYQPDGTVWALLILHYDLGQFLMDAGLFELSDRYRYYLDFEHMGGDDSYIVGQKPGEQDDTVSLELSYSLLQWDMYLVPHVSWITGLWALRIYGILGVLVSFLVGLFIYHRQIDRKLLTLRSHTDSLTGFLNKREILLEIERELKEGRNFAIALLDIDDFKMLNDTYGHLSGDKALLALSENLKQNIRMSDSIGRFGGDEFVLVLRTCVRQDSCRRIYQSISNTAIMLGGQKRDVVVSMGVAFSRKDGKSCEELLEVADRRLYRAKQEGKAKLCSEG